MTKVTVYDFNDSQCVNENALTNDIVPHSSRLDNVYAINLDHISLMHLSCLKASLGNAWLRHHSLGHISVHTLHKFIKHDLVRGLWPYKYQKDYACSACVKGKQVVHPSNP